MHVYTIVGLYIHTGTVILLYILYRYYDRIVRSYILYRSKMVLIIRYQISLISADIIDISMQISGISCNNYYNDESTNRLVDTPGDPGSQWDPQVLLGSQI